MLRCQRPFTCSGAELNFSGDSFTGPNRVCGTLVYLSASDDDWTWVSNPKDGHVGSWSRLGDS